MRRDTDWVDEMDPEVRADMLSADIEAELNGEY